MTKKEIIWREILNEFERNKKGNFTQKALANKFSFSLSTIFNALKVPRAIGTVEVTGRDFRVRDFEKFLYLWATVRSLKREIIYQTHIDMGVRSAEGILPPKTILGAFTAYRFKYKDVPADYDKIYVYATSLSEIQKRFPKQKGYANFFVLKADPFLHNYGKTTADVQTFVDLWNLEDWYAKDFLKALKEKMGI